MRGHVLLAVSPFEVSSPALSHACSCRACAYLVIPEFISLPLVRLEFEAHHDVVEAVEVLRRAACMTPTTRTREHNRIRAYTTMTKVFEFE
jgi:hypothetical protein